MASILFRAVLVALLVGVEGLGQHRRHVQDKQLKVAADDVEEDIANQLVKEAEATVERESDTPKESNGTKVKVETKKDSKEVKAATKTPKVTPPSNTTVEESDDAFEKEILDMDSNSTNQTVKEERSGCQAVAVSAVVLLLSATHFA